MNKINSNGLSGDLNYLVTNYLLKQISLQPEETETLLSKIKENLNFGSIYDFDLNTHQCSYELKKEIYERVEKRKLDDIYESSLNFNLGTGFNKEKNEILQKEKNIFLNDDKMDTKLGHGFEEGREKKNPETRYNYFNHLRDSRFPCKIGTSLKENLQESKIKSFKHMKSILGHISTVDDNIINPVAIYCICYSNDNELIFTGDNNGLIKIWSSRTGALVENFKSHEKAINDTLLINDYLISCSEDMSIKIWNVKLLSLVKTLNFEESIIRVLFYEYTNDLTKKLHNVVIASSHSGKIYIFDLEKVVDDVKTHEYENEAIITKIYFDQTIIDKFSLKKIKNSLQQSCMAIHNNPGIMICGYNEGLICAWDVKKILDEAIKNHKFIYDFKKYILFLECVHNSLVHISEFDKVGDYFITAGIDGHVLVWKVQATILKLQRKNQKPEDSYPIFSIFKICENEERIRCSVNVAIWSTYNNYVVSIISSKSRRKTNTNLQSNQNQYRNQSIANLSGSNAIDSLPPIINSHLRDNNNNDDSSNRTSSILVYSKSSNSVIKRYDQKNGLTIHDECYVLEPHPENDEVILTVLNSNEILVFNFLSGNILCRFTEENYFFNNISQNMMALEGKFSPNGDSFVISTYLGSISIYSIYSNNSYQTTYMNQFFDKEFTSNANDDHSSNLALQSDLPFIEYVNMHNLPYITQQPYSKYKLNHLEKTCFKRLINNYNYSQRQIENKLMNNYQIYSKNLEERRIECEREERIFTNSAKENLNYIVPDNLENDSSESEFESNNSEYNSNNDLTSNIMLVNQDDEDEAMSVSKSSLDLERGEEPEDYHIGTYNLRSRRQNNRNRRRNSNRLNSIRQSNIISNNTRSSRMRTRNQNTIEEINENSGNVSRDDFMEENIEVVLPNARKSRRRLRKINRTRNGDGRNSADSSKIIEDNSESDEDFSFDKKLKKPSIVVNVNNIEHEKELGYDQEIKELINNCKEIESTCFLCKFTSTSLIGPFKTENFIDFNIITEEISMIDQESIDNKIFYFHIDCLISFNDFIIINTKRRRQNNRVNLSHTIKEILSAGKKCWRCNSDFATKKCSDENCERYFHGYYCLPQYCIESESESKMVYCLECYRNKSLQELESEEQTLNRKNESSANNNLKLNKLSREFFLREKFSFYSYLPQIGDKVYFVIHAYEQFLRNYFENILLELNDKNIFFWKSEEFCNNSLNNFQTNYTTPFQCEVLNMEYIFPNNKSVALIKKLYGSQWDEKLKILIKLKLKVLSSNKEIEIIFFENSNADFLINPCLYEKNFDSFLELKSKIDKKHFKESSDQNEDEYILKELTIVMGEEVYSARLNKLECKENNEIYKDSIFENISVKYEGEEELDHDDQVLRISFWDMFSPDLEKSKDELIISLMENLSTKIDEIYNRNLKKFHPFYEMVDEVKDMAKDYYNLLQVPMFLKLIKSRLDNFYYLNTQSIEFDLDLIEKNAQIYNSSTAQITKNSRQLVSEIKLAMNGIAKSMKIREISGRNLSAIDSSACKSLKRNSMMRGIDLPEEINNFNNSNLLNGTKLRRRNDNNLNINNLTSSYTDSMPKLNSKNKTITNGHDRKKLRYSNRIQIKKKDVEDDVEIGLKDDLSIDSGKSAEKENLSRDYDISEEYSAQIANRPRTRNSNKNNNNNISNNISNSNEKGTYNLRRKRQRNSEENYE